jgi:hypothetical protein
MADELEQVSISLPRSLVERRRAEAAKTNDSVSHVWVSLSRARR